VQELKAQPSLAFTYQKYPDLDIPNTTNSLDGCFAYLKELVVGAQGPKQGTQG
jgi:hypothetical protein